MQLNPAIFQFFKQLAKNNNREWFEQHKPEFKALETEVKQFGEALKDKLNQHDSIALGCGFYRIALQFTPSVFKGWRIDKVSVFVSV